jgi:choline kinase
MCLNADVLCDPDILIPAARTTAPISMIVDPAWRDETMKVIIRNGRVSRMSKKIHRSEFSGTYIGITTFSVGVQRDFFRSLDKFIASGRVNEFFNVAVQELADAGVRVGYTSTHGLPWAEIDDPADLAFAREHVFPKLAQVAAA